MTRDRKTRLVDYYLRRLGQALRERDQEAMRVFARRLRQLLGVRAAQ
jgi:hypothetical protein